MVTKLIYKTELNNVITKHHYIISLHNIVIKQGYVKQLYNAVTQRRDETLYRAAVLTLYQTKVRRSGGLFHFTRRKSGTLVGFSRYHFTRLKRRSARVRQARQVPPTPRPTRAYIRGRELESWSWS